MKKGPTLGLDELMIINPSRKGGRYMFYHPLHGYIMSQPPEANVEMFGDTGQYSEEGYAGWGQFAEDDINAYGQYPEEQMGGYGQFPEEEVGYYGQYPQDDGTGYGRYPEDDMGDYGQYPDEDLSQYYEDDLGQLPEEEMGGYGQNPEDDMGYYGQYPQDPLEGYVRETEPPFNPRGDFGPQLSGYEREKTVNPTCAFERPAQAAPASPAPDFFKPYL